MDVVGADGADGYHHWPPPPIDSRPVYYCDGASDDNGGHLLYAVIVARLSMAKTSSFY